MTDSLTDTVTSALPDADLDAHAERAGRIALATQGALYVLVGLLAAAVAMGDHEARPSQSGALESVARQPFGRVLLVAAIVGLAAHAAWRLWLAAKGEPGDDPDAKEVAKRVANAGRAAIYVGFLAAAVRLLTKAGGSSEAGGSDTEQQSTDTVLALPGGPWIVVAAGLVGLGVAAWNVRKAVTQSFCDDLDFGRLDAAKEPIVRKVGTAGYLARAAAFGLIGWFLIEAGRQHDPSESRGLDDALRELATAPFGPILLLAVAVGLAAFGAFRVLDGMARKPRALTRS